MPRKIARVGGTRSSTPITSVRKPGVIRNAPPRITMAPSKTSRVGTLGLVYDVEIQGRDVYVTFTLTYPGCPIGPQVSEQVKEFVGELEGVDAVYPKMVFDPPWSPDMMSEDAKFALGY